MNDETVNHHSFVNVLLVCWRPIQKLIRPENLTVVAVLWPEDGNISSYPLAAQSDRDQRRVAQLWHRTFAKRHKTMENPEREVRLEASQPST